MDLIATINTILLPPILLVVLISFVSALIYDEGSSKAPEKSLPKNATAKIIQPIERELREVLWSDLWAEPEVPTVQPAAESAIPVAAMPKPEAVPTLESTLPPTEAQVLQIISRLDKRESRPLCKPLKIQQKRNGTELSLDFIRGAIRRKFNENPALVIATIREKLPHLLPSEPESKPEPLEVAAG